MTNELKLKDCKIDNYDGIQRMNVENTYAFLGKFTNNDDQCRLRNCTEKSTLAGVFTLSRHRH